MDKNQSPVTQPPSILSKLGSNVEGRLVQNIITILILLNAITLGLETNSDVMSHFGIYLKTFDNVILTIFVGELGIKLAYRRLSFFKNGWNIFDFIIITVALLPSSGPMSVLRTLRIFRAMRLLSLVPSMRKVTQALFAAIPGIFSVGSMILLIFYVSAVLSTNFFGNDFDAWFGNIGRSMFTLFQIMTLESWSMGIVRPVMESYPWSWIFFVPFILVTSFAVLNLFIGIIVDAMQNQNKNKKEIDSFSTRQEISDLMALNKEMAALRDDIKELGKRLNKL